MPAKSKKSDDFDDIIAEHLRATATIKISSSSSSTPVTFSISEDAMVKCCIDGNLTRLRLWASKGVKVASAVPLVQAAMGGKLAVVRCLVRDLGADVNKATHNGCTLVYAARVCCSLGGARGCCAVLGQGVQR
jgi:hypothetical protein